MPRSGSRQVRRSQRGLSTTLTFAGRSETSRSTAAAPHLVADERLSDASPPALGELHPALAAVADAIALIDVPIAVIDLELRVRAVNPALVLVFGLDAETLIGQPVNSFVQGHSSDAPTTNQLKLLATGGSQTVRRILLDATRPGFEVYSTSTVVTDGAGCNVGIVATLREVTSMETLAARYAQATVDEKTLLSQLPIAVFATENDKVTFVNDAACALFGVADAEELDARRRVGAHLAVTDQVLRSARAEMLSQGLVPPEPSAFTVERPDGTRRSVEGRAIPTRLGGVDIVVYTVLDVTDARRAAAEVHRMAFRDTLTGLANRRSLVIELERRFVERTPTTVLFCDLDGFKAVNDRFGHAAGDLILDDVASSLASTVSGDDLACRFAGDEFVVVVDPDAAADVITRIESTFSASPPLGGAYGPVGVSVGAADLAFAAASAAEAIDDVLRRSDRAMYAVKRVRAHTGGRVDGRR